MSNKQVKYYINNQPVTESQFYHHMNVLDSLDYISFNSYDVKEREIISITHYNKAHEKTVVFKKIWQQ